MKRKLIIKRIVLLIVVVFIGIQFVPSTYNQSDTLLETDISNTFDIPSKIQTLLENSCYDCHSNNTYYPWYNNIQPMSWMMERHIKNGKKELNFSEFGAYSKRRKKSKIKSIINQIKDDEMPLSSYTLLHRNAILSESDKLLIINWMENQRNNLK